MFTLPRILLGLCPALLLPAALSAQTNPSALLASGLGPAEAELAALADPMPSDLFLLAGVRFLGGLEAALQTRYRVGLDPDLLILDLPVMRLPIPENPNPEVFTPEIVTEMFAAVLTDMEGAATALEAIEGDVAVRLNTADIWFDIDMNGRRGEGEDLGSVIGLGFGTRLPAITVNFDTADRHWLTAYAHLLAGISELVLAFDPTEAITEIRDARAAMEALNAETGEPFGTSWDMSFGDYVDYAAIVLGAIERQPDADRTRAAHAHFLSVIGENRIFWRLVAQETDNDAEWIPNKNQQSATGIPFPADTGARWLSVLSDAEAVLKGDALIPFWRLSPGTGIDLNALFQNPPEVDVINMIQGADLLPYARVGRVMRGDSFMMFAQMMGGNAGLYMVMIN